MAANPNKPKANRRTKPKPVVKAAWVPDQIEQWPLDKFTAADRNPRTHPKSQIEALAARYRVVGFTKPVFARRNGKLIAGHGRIEAAKLAGLATAPVIVAPDSWTDAQCRAELLADNALGDNSKWDNDLLALESAELASLGMDLEALGLLPLDPTTARGSNKPDAGDVEFESLFQVLIECKNEAEQLELLKRLAADGVKCRALIA